MWVVLPLDRQCFLPAAVHASDPLSPCAPQVAHSERHLLRASLPWAAPVAGMSHRCTPCLDKLQLLWVRGVARGAWLPLGTEFSLGHYGLKSSNLKR